MSEDDDYYEIRRTLALYPKAADDRDPDAYASLFTEDALLVNHGKLFSGRAKIREFLARLYPAQFPGRVRWHCFSNHVITLKGDTADVASDLVSLDCLPERIWQVRMVVRHTDRLARQPDGRWLFTFKHMTGTGFVRDPHTLPWEE